MEARPSHQCPHLDASDSRCASRFSLASLEDAFGICHGGFHGCAIYHRINLEASLRARIGPEAAARILPPGKMPGLMEPHAQGRATKQA
ncbi:MAG: hypothetical protein FJ254_09390 [Phycisphaerae bacterium]|nr:hypothetical protein [Phycisphaerae bacterium]